MDMRLFSFLAPLSCCMASSSAPLYFLGFPFSSAGSAFFHSWTPKPRQLPATEEEKKAFFSRQTALQVKRSCVHSLSRLGLRFPLGASCKVMHAFSRFPLPMVIVFPLSAFSISRGSILDDFVSDANDSLRFHLIRDERDVPDAPDKGGFPPEMTHQVFGEQ